MTRLLRAALRLNPSRILIGEVRGPEALDFLRAANTGHPGSLLTVHANSAADSLHRLDTLAQEAGVPPQLARVAEAVDLVVFVTRSAARRRVVEVLRVGGLGTGGRPQTERLYNCATHHPDPRSRPLPLHIGGDS
jgi:type IV secretion system protein VirB11